MAPAWRCRRSAALRTRDRSVETTTAHRKKCRILPLSHLLTLWSAVQDAARRPGRLHRITAVANDPAQHWLHPVPTVVIGLRGVVRIGRGPKPPIDLHPGDATAIAPGALHEHVPLRRGAAELALGFDCGMCDLVLSSAEVRIPAVLPQQPAWQMVARLVDGDATALPDLLALVLDRPLRDIPPLPVAVRRMRDRIRTHGLTRISATDLATASGLGTSRAWQLFRAHVGCTPRQALERRRCAVAAALLGQGTTVAEAATRCGFTDRGTFTRAFTRIQGVTPTAWQRRGLRRQ